MLGPDPFKTSFLDIKSLLSECSSSLYYIYNIFIFILYFPYSKKVGRREEDVSSVTTNKEQGMAQLWECETVSKII